MSQGSFSPKIRFLGQKVCSVARSWTDRQTDTKVKIEDTLSGFQDFFQIFLQPIIKERSNMELGSLFQCNSDIGILFFGYAGRRAILVIDGQFGYVKV